MMIRSLVQSNVVSSCTGVDVDATADSYSILEQVEVVSTNVRAAWAVSRHWRTSCNVQSRLQNRPRVVPDINWMAGVSSTTSRIWHPPLASSRLLSSYNRPRQTGMLWDLADAITTVLFVAREDEEEDCIIR